jgi:pimeloyl-ACP methyl ester carboxylesterase
MKPTLRFSLLLFTTVCVTGRAQTPESQRGPKSAAHMRVPRTTGDRFMVDRGNVHIEVIAQGAGPVIVILPSLGRGAEDYDVIADLLVKGGFRVLRPQPRGIGASTGSMASLTLHDLAADIQQ